MKKTTLFSKYFSKKSQCRPRMLVSGTQILDSRLKLAGMTMMLGAAFLLPLSSSAVFAQMPVPMAGAVMPSGLERIGVVAAAGGRVELTTPGQVGRIAESGQPVFLGDLVSTDAKGHLQILLLDETVFTIGPSSAITIDKFVYDPKTSTGEIRASITKGVFRYVSGKIAVKNPSKVTVKLPTATIGFRGTIVGGSLGATGQGLVGLMGPGDNNDSGAQTGSFTVDGAGGDHQDVNRTGFGVEVGADGGVSNVFQLSDEQINGLTGGLGGGGQGGGGGGGEGDGEGGGLGGDTDMGALSGEDGALTGDSISGMQILGDLGDENNSLTNTASQDNRTNNSSGSTTATLGSITTLDDMKAVGSQGSYHFEQTSVDLLDGNSEVVGRYDIFVNINFANENSSVGGGSSRVVVNGVQVFDLAQKSFSSDQSASGVFSFTNVPFPLPPSTTNYIDLDLTILNTAGGEVGCFDSTATQFSHNVTYGDSSHNVIGTGHTTDQDAGRQPGAYTP